MKEKSLKKTAYKKALTGKVYVDDYSRNSVSVKWEGYAFS